MHYFGVNCGPIALIFHKKKERSILKSQNVENWTYQVLISKFRLLFACSSCMSTSSFNSKNFSNQAQPRSHAHHTSFTQVTARFPSRAFGAPWDKSTVKRQNLKFHPWKRLIWCWQSFLCTIQIFSLHFMSFVLYACVRWHSYNQVHGNAWHPEEHGGGGFFHSKGTWGYAACKGMLFQTF